MVRSQKILSVLLASPGDLGDERQFARDCVAEWNSVNAERTGWIVELLGWEDTLPQAGRPQELINRDVRRCMLFIGMMHRHWGSETGNGYTSGFHEEFSLASQLYEREGRPRIALFFKHPGTVGDPGEQLKQVLAFKDTIKTSKKFLYKELGSEAEAWQSGFRQNLHRTIFELVDELEIGFEIGGDAAAEPPEPASAAEDRNPSASETGQNVRLVELHSLVERIACISPEGDAPAEEVARLRLLGASWHVPGLSETYLGTHDANVILRDVAVSKLSTPEVLGLIDAGLANMASQSTPLWRWVAREDKDFHYLKALAIWGDDDAVRIGALKVLAWGKVSLEPSSFIPDRMGESGTQLRDAIYEYLSRQDDAESLLLLQAEFQKADYKNEVALVTALLRRLSRQSSDVPIRFLALENATPPYGRRTPDWAELSHFTDDELRTAFRHRDADVRAEAAIQLGRRDLLSSDEKLALRNDPSASLRAAGVQIAIEDGETLALADAERIIVRRTKNALMQSPEGARQYEQVRRRLLETFTSEDLLREAEALYEPAEDAYEILLRREWKARAEVARGEVKGGFRTHFDDILAPASCSSRRCRCGAGPAREHGLDLRVPRQLHDPRGP